jgi:BirA family biotin operon repressor/biotin-[acetyl-CoA-carboxylase] ligase
MLSLPVMEQDENSYGSLLAALETRFIGKNIIYYPRLPSTMDAARDEARRGAAGGTVVIAGEQTGGRGRLRRAWFTPPGNVALSVVLYPGLADLPYLIMIASLAVARAVENLAGLRTQIKWPNDVLIGGRKVCGILVESEVRAGKATAIVGIGINVRLRPADFDGIAGTATSLENEGARISPPEIARAVLEEFEKLYLILPDGSKIFAAWRERLVTLGRKVAARWGETMLDGIAEDVDASGALLIRRADGSLTRVVAGDVTLWEE